MMAVTKSLSSGVHQVTMNDETENIQFVPQIVSTLRLDLVFWRKTEGGSQILFLKKQKVQI